MPKYYSALKMKMGEWDYFVVKMRMADAASEIKFASEVNDDRTLDHAIQRVINLSRAKTQIVKYLQTNPERFFGSLVVAALGGSPKWFPVNIEDNPQFAMVASEVSDSFGILLFDDTIKTYALDGQHRLYAIKQLVDGQAEEPAPLGFSDETLSVIFVVPQEDTTRADFLRSYRRLFSSLNRHAKSTAMNTNIIMDEDDRFAILTRRLISEFEFFQWDGNGPTKIDTEKSSENLTATSTAFATIVGLYKMNVHLLWDQDFVTDYGRPMSGSSWKELIQTSPDDDEMETMFEDLQRIWDGILLTLPELNSEPINMRSHGHEYGDEHHDSLLFWPIGQTGLLAPIVRRLLNENGIDESASGTEVAGALEPLKMVPWDLKHNLWKNLLITPDPESGNWKMRDTDRTNCIKCAYSILLWLTGCETLSAEDIDDLRGKWSALLLPLADQEREEETFKELLDIHDRIRS
jgi:DNA sulfur modification protein DndB